MFLKIRQVKVKSVYRLEARLNFRSKTDTNSQNCGIKLCLLQMQTKMEIFEAIAEKASSPMWQVVSLTCFQIFPRHLCQYGLCTLLWMLSLDAWLSDWAVEHRKKENVQVLSPKPSPTKPLRKDQAL